MNTTFAPQTTVAHKLTWKLARKILTDIVVSITVYVLLVVGFAAMAVVYLAL